ncbi:hypothetical protein IFM89_005001 [Coptis chinensis]|uniref:WIYLD domain-containing protein n=1 Tax=Coptis chinensis TaxID=261450 RepID=A0A835HKX3_9MAGN|nr:hypothetical protein IFM89_005001 [Coptis chinensis]
MILSLHFDIKTLYMVEFDIRGRHGAKSAMIVPGTKPDLTHLRSFLVEDWMAEVPRHKKAFIAMRALGVDDKTTETLLKNLLKVYKNWEPIEEENYRVLADVIFEDGKNQVEEARKRKESQSSSDYEHQPKKLNSTQQESRASHSGGYPLQSSV